MKTKEIFVKFFIILNFLLLFYGNVSAVTAVSGPISSDTTWTVADSPYAVTGNVLVMEGVTLTIEPGVVIRFDSGRCLQIDGELIARGTGAQMIVFTSNQFSPAAGDWGYIFFSDSSIDAAYDLDGNYTNGSILEYCIVEYAGGVSVANNGAVRMDGAHPFINYATVQNNTATGIYAWDLTGNLKIINSDICNNTGSGSGGGIYVYGGITIITHSTLSNNTASQSGGAVSARYSSVTITHSTLSHNTASNSGGAISASSSIATITHSTLSNNRASQSGGAISAAGGSVTITHSTLSHNTASNSGGAIYVEYGYDGVTISNNIITKNTTDGFNIYLNWCNGNISHNIISNNIGGGIFYEIWSMGTISAISNNTLADNIALNSAAIVNLKSNCLDFKYNTITGNQATGAVDTRTISVSGNPLINYNNIFHNAATYELWNVNAQSAAVVNVENNWWGTELETEILEKIYDWFDNAANGLVDYAPWSTAIRTDTPISPPAGLTVAEDAGSIALGWDANTEGDVAGYKLYWDTDAGFPYANVLDVGNVTSYATTELTGTYYVFTVTAYDNDYDPADDDPATLVNENQTNGHESWYATPVNIKGTGTLEVTPETDFEASGSPGGPFDPASKTYTLENWNPEGLRR
jgi:parallel beta-helix repeat protein/predicted outer membrane repeat protein